LNKSGKWRFESDFASNECILTSISRQSEYHSILDQDTAPESPIDHSDVWRRVETSEDDDLSSGGSTYEVTDDSLNVDEEEPHDEAADPELAQLLEQADTAMAAPPPVIPPAELKLRNTAKFLLNTAKTIAGKDATQSHS